MLPVLEFEPDLCIELFAERLRVQQRRLDDNIADASGCCYCRLGELNFGYQFNNIFFDPGLTLTLFPTLCNDGPVIEKGTPAERQGRKTSGLRVFLR